MNKNLCLQGVHHLPESFASSEPTFFQAFDRSADPTFDLTLQEQTESEPSRWHHFYKLKDVSKHDRVQSFI